MEKTRCRAMPPQRNQSFFPTNQDRRLLLHSCCAPCSGGIIRRFLDDGFSFTVYFYNPNIHPKKEYDKRKNELLHFCQKLNISFIDGDYDVVDWFKWARKFKKEPERGERCCQCFNMRLLKTAEYAHDHSFRVFTSSLGISRWKNLSQVNTAGLRSASLFPNLAYWDCSWRKKGGMHRMAEVTEEEHFYRQKYCGCLYSLREHKNKALLPSRI